MNAGQRLHGRALRLAQRVGKAIAFSEVSEEYDPATATYTASASSVAGYAVRDKPDLEQYQALGLIATTAETLLFSPNTWGQEPDLGATCTWEGDTYTVRQTERFGPDSKPSQLRVVMSR